jgi:hypothetical protein
METLAGLAVLVEEVLVVLLVLGHRVKVIPLEHPCQAALEVAAVKVELEVQHLVLVQV